jgi:hypothetical protein
MSHSSSAEMKPSRPTLYDAHARPTDSHCEEFPVYDLRQQCGRGTRHSSGGRSAIIGAPLLLFPLFFESRSPLRQLA